MHQQQRGPGRPVVWAFVTAAVAALLVGAAVAGVAYARGGGKARAGAAPTTTRPVTYDPAALQACQVRKLRTTVGRRAETVMRRSLEATDDSDQVALREIHIRYAPGGTRPDLLTLRDAAAAIATWCSDNHIG
ncbi:hypothetical protein [Actinomadura montaniterrae]|uniref:Uncharacterized protein n=1 Tax=Actinomadura montaniterrae TaxID=1803903 RepID=A0A6L3W5Y1_9ACTN|nr:hypothetical protein [Actinomadura montaniterrae]KAB2384775.1 hypothetical protein F9B16_10025 [Actinomadura montaniterrae]